MMYTIQFRRGFHSAPIVIFKDADALNDYLYWVRSGEDGKRFVDEKDILAIWKIAPKRKRLVISDYNSKKLIANGYLNPDGSPKLSTLREK